MLTEEVDVPRGTSEWCLPGAQHDGALEDKATSPLGLRESIEESLDREVLEYLVVGFAALLRLVQQSRADGGRYVLQI